MRQSGDRMTDRMSVLMVSSGFYPKIGGTERQAELLARALQKIGVGVEVLAIRFQKDLPLEETVSGLKICRIPYPRIRYLSTAVILVRLAAFLIRSRHRYDVIHVHMVGYLAFAATWTARLLKKPIVLKFAVRPTGENASFGDFPEAVRKVPLLRTLLMGGVRRADRFIAISAMIRQMAIEAGFPAERVVNIPNAVDLEAYRPADREERARLRRRLNLPNGPVVLFSGRIVRRKGVADLLEAWRLLKFEEPESMLCLIGTGKDLEEMRLLAEKAGISDSVRFQGVVENVSDYLRAADLYVLPSHFEGMPNSLLEAMACELPVVATAVSGVVDLVRNGRNGVLVDPGRPGDFAEGMILLLKDPQRASRLGKAARETVSKNCSVGKLAALYADLYEQLKKEKNQFGKGGAG